MAEQRMLQECSLLLYCDCQSQDQFLGRGLLLSVFPFLHFFLLSYLYPHFFLFTVSLDSSSELSAGGFMTCCLTCLFFFVCLFVYQSFCCVAVITARCIVFRGPGAAARLQSDALYAFVASPLLPHTGHGPPLPWSYVAVCSLLDWILLLLLSVSYGSQPWVSALSLSEQDAQAKGTRGEGKKKTLVWPESKYLLIFPGRCF